MVRHVWTSQQLRPEFPIPGEPGISFGETVIISCRLRPGFAGMLSVD